MRYFIVFITISNLAPAYIFLAPPLAFTNFFTIMEL